jgi:diaminohydroxyphosphoribosylaminopyrimidine deaminase/5-amino-6-(5-phosphoribosylamino)uracil reductase
MGTTYPNPMVGSLLAYNDTLLGEGFTSAYGGPHAEVNAIQSVKEKSLLKKATLYVTLEPCSHFGKTPPCTDLILASKIPNVVIGTMDPHDKVAGKGIEKLRAAGCHVVVGILEKECREHHKRFLTYHEKKRPYIILKWAQSADGFIAPSPESRKGGPAPHWISSLNARQLVHKWRSEEHAVLVGSNTVLDDNPQLNVRLWSGPSPIRVVLDRELKIKDDFHIMDGSIKTIVITEAINKSSYKDHVHYETLNFSGDLAPQICQMLHTQKIISILIEGGARTLQTFIDADLWDEARVFVSAMPLDNGLMAPTFAGRLKACKKIGSDILNLYAND